MHRTNQKNMLKVLRKSIKAAENKEVAKLRNKYQSNLDFDLEWLRQESFTELDGHDARDARRIFRDVLVNSLRANNFFNNISNRLSQKDAKLNPPDRLVLNALIKLKEKQGFEPYIKENNKLNDIVAKKEKLNYDPKTGSLKKA